MDLFPGSLPCGCNAFSLLYSFIYNAIMDEERQQHLYLCTLWFILHGHFSQQNYVFVSFSNLSTGFLSANLIAGGSCFLRLCIVLHTSQSSFSQCSHLIQIGRNLAYYLILRCSALHQNFSCFVSQHERITSRLN